MGKKGSVRSVIPVEETIIDPLYEPLKLNRYELCEHLLRLKDVSHLRYGFSPYLLFDVEGMKEVVVEILKIEEEEINEIFNYKDFVEKLKEYLKKLEELPRVTNKDRNKLYEDLKKIRDEIKEIYDGIKEICQNSLNKTFYSSNGFKKEKFDKIAHLFQLEYPVKIKCPLCEKEAITNSDVKPYMFMCEEGKIYSMKEALLRTFELRRARWLYMSGSLHIVHRASTHTRLSHEIGSMIVAVNAPREIDVYPYGDMSMSLGEYLLMRGELHEFLIANFLHDLGHPPLSHVLEPNPFIELDHEKITRNLILGERVEEEEGIDWYVAERYLLRMKAIKDFEFRFFENRYDSRYDVGEKEEWTDEKRRANFLRCLGKNNEILDLEIITVSEVLDNFGVDRERVVEILKGEIFCPGCRKFWKIRDLKKVFHDSYGVECEEEHKQEQGIQWVYDIQFLNKLIDSEIDFDRIDHVRRDSVICGLSLTAFRLIEILGSFSIVLPGSNLYKKIYGKEVEKMKSTFSSKKGLTYYESKIKIPYIFISEDGLSYVMDLLNSRRAIYNNVMFSNENNWINGVVNQITALTMRYLPHLTNMLPFITDQILMHYYMNDLFLETQIEKLNKLFHGKMDCSAYEKPMRCRLKDEEKIPEEQLKQIYVQIEKINDGEDYRKMDMPAVVFYTNIKAKEEEKGKKWDRMLIYGKKFEGKYYPFQKLVDMRYQGITRERFPEKPSELDVKNLFYVWVSNFVVSERNIDIKAKIGEVWAGKLGSRDDKIKAFKDRFVDLDEVKGGS